MAERPEIADYIRRFSLAGLLSPQLLSKLELRRYRRGERIVQAGSPAKGLFLVVEGRAKVYSQMENGLSLLVSFIAPFDILGDVELFSRENFLLDAEALTETACLFLSKSEILKQPESNVPLLLCLCTRLGRKLADFNTSAAVNLRYPVANRLASYLLTLEEGKDTESLGTSSISEIAELLGTSYRQLSRVLKQLRDEGILDERRCSIAIKDRARLEALAKESYR